MARHINYNIEWPDWGHTLRKHNSVFDERDLRWLNCHMFKSFKLWLSLRSFSPFKTHSFDFSPCAVLLVQVSHLYEAAFLCAPFWQIAYVLYQSVWGYFLLLAKLNSSCWLSENINLHLMFLVGLELWIIKSRPQNSTQCVELVTWRRLPPAGLPLDTFAFSLRPAVICGRHIACMW